MKLEDINVGDYVRTKFGIAKIVETKPWGDFDFALDKDLFMFRASDMRGFFTSCGYKIEIIKSSKNLIDLIEVGDYVNGFKVDKDEIGLKIEMYNDNCSYLMNSGIKTIITKEQIKEMEYTV